MAILSKYDLDRYQFGTDVTKRHQLYGMSGKIIYEGKWVTKSKGKIIIVEMDQAITEREAEFYLAVNNHENIIQTLGYVDNTENLTIFIQEYARLNDLGSVLLDNQFNLSPMVLMEMFIQIADAMSYVARKRIIHGDLGCRNVLVFQVDPNDPKNNRVKLTDFGLARWMDRPLKTEDKIIPIRFCALEILQHNRHESYSEKSDVYSFAVFIWETLSNGEMPYSSVSKDEDVITKKLSNEKLPKPNACDAQLWSLMNTCWHRNPDQRLTFEEVREDLMNMDISNVPSDLITASSHRVQLPCKYQLDTHVEIVDSMNKDSPIVYGARWVTDDQGPIVLIEKNDIPSEHEQLFYTAFKKHPHIVRTFGYVGNDRGTTMILQERAPHGNLQSLLTSGRFQPTEPVLMEIFRQVIDTMMDVVGAGLVHGDLRCENILVFKMHPTDPKQNEVKLSNFSLAHRDDPSVIDDRRLNIPVRYCALEILRSAGRSNYSQYSDVYSMGVLMWQALSNGRLPYDSSITMAEVRQRKLNGEKLSRLPQWQQDIWSIMEDCWFIEPQLRYEFEGMKTRLSQVTLPVVKVEHPRGNVNRAFEGDDDRTESKPKRPRHEPRQSARSPSQQDYQTGFSPASVQYSTCPYCNQQVIDPNNHQKTCEVMLQFTKSESNKPTETRVTDRNPTHKTNHAPSARAVTQQPKNPSVTAQNQTKQETPRPVENSRRQPTQPEPRSFWARICPCFRS